MKTKYQIRDAGVDDAATLNVLRAECLAERDVDIHHVWAKTREHIDVRLGTSLYAKILEVDGDVAGLAFVETYDSLPSVQNRRGRVAQIRGLYIKPQYRQNQLGTSLVMECVLKARELGASYAEVHVQDDYQDIFTRVGFENKLGGLRLYFK